MSEIDETKSLFEHIRNRLPTGYGLGDDGTVYKDNVPDHSVFQQSLREDSEGDVGIFEILTIQEKIALGAIAWKTKLQIGVVTVNGDIDSAVNYLKTAFENIKKNRKSTGISVYDAELAYIMPVGKKSAGIHMVTMNLTIRYTILN